MAPVAACSPTWSACDLPWLRRRRSTRTRGSDRRSDRTMLVVPSVLPSSTTMTCASASISSTTPSSSFSDTSIESASLYAGITNEMVVLRGVGCPSGAGPGATPSNVELALAVVSGEGRVTLATGPKLRSAPAVVEGSARSARTPR